MASTSSEGNNHISGHLLNTVKSLIWGQEIKHDVFKRWSQGFNYSEDESTALLQHEGGPCAVIAPVQAFFLKSLMFSPKTEDESTQWRKIIGCDRDAKFVDALVMMFQMLVSRSAENFYLVSRLTGSKKHDKKENQEENSSDASNSMQEQTETLGSSPKKPCFSHEQFHSTLKCLKCDSKEMLTEKIMQNVKSFQDQYGVLLLLYSFILTKGVEQIKNEVEDSSEPLIDGLHGHGTQSLINLLITGKAVTNVWDNDKDVSGLKLRGISDRATVGFLTLMEHLRYCEVGWNYKNPKYPIWLLGSETHLTILFSEERNLVSGDSPEDEAKRAFNTYDKDSSGFILAEMLGDLMADLNLVSEPEYVSIMRDKLDPEKLGIVTLHSFLQEFYPNSEIQDALKRFTLYHYNGLKRSCPNKKVIYLDASATLLDEPELQIITDTSAIKTCLMTKWPTIELTWANDCIPSLN